MSIHEFDISGLLVKIDGVSVKCPCGGTAVVGHDTADDTPSAMHTLPFCKEYEEMDVIDFTTYVRKSITGANVILFHKDKKS